MYFTCNPKCKDITDALPAGQEASTCLQNKPRRAHERHQTETCSRQTCGIYLRRQISERGLPVTHLLIMLADGSKFRVPVDIDSLICAGIPDPVTQSEIYEIVSPCMADGQCTKDYPRLSGMSCLGLVLPDIDGTEIMAAAHEFDIALEEMEAVTQMSKLNGEYDPTRPGQNQEWTSTQESGILLRWSWS